MLRAIAQSLVAVSFALVSLAFVSAVAGTARADDTLPNISDSIAVLQSATRGDDDQSKLAAAWRQVSSLPAEQLTTVLAAMKDCGPLADNWLRAAVDTIAERERSAGRPLPGEQLEAFVLDRTQGPRARRLAFQWLATVDKTANARLIPGMLDDHSLELRYLAVAAQIEQASKLSGSPAASAYRVALEAARDLDQLQACAKALEKHDIKINVAEQLGYITNWQLIGIFDNKDRAGFAAVFPPERELNFAAKYDGLGKQVGWIEHHTDHKLGKVDLNKVYGEIKEVIAYAAGEVTVDRPVVAEVRFSCIAAVKVWVNGKMVADHEIYHSGSRFDQYAATVPLQAGRNTILVKVCQNEQTQSWANVWDFSLRVCDASGGRILPRATSAKPEK